MSITNPHICDRFAEPKSSESPLAGMSDQEMFEMLSEKDQQSIKDDFIYHGFEAMTVEQQRDIWKDGERMSDYAVGHEKACWDDWLHEKLQRDSWIMDKIEALAIANRD